MPTNDRISQAGISKTTPKANKALNQPIPVEAITALRFVDRDGNKFYLESLRNGQYLLRPLPKDA